MNELNSSTAKTNVNSLLTDDDALSVYRAIPTEQDEGKRSALVGLLSGYTEAKRAAGLQPFQPSADKQNAQVDRFEGLYGSLDDVEKTMAPEQSAKLQGLLSTSADPKEAKARMVNMAYIQSMHGSKLPAGWDDALWPGIRASYANQAFGVDKPDMTDVELYGAISGRVKQDKEDRAMAAELVNKMHQSAFKGEGDWMKAYEQAKPADDPSKPMTAASRDKMRMIAKNSFNQVKEKADRLRPVADDIVGSLARIKGTQKGFEDVRGFSMDELIAKVDAVPDADRPLLYSVIAQQVGATPELFDEKGVLQQSGESIGRGFVDVAKSNKRAISDNPELINARALKAAGDNVAVAGERKPGESMVSWVSRSMQGNYGIVDFAKDVITQNGQPFLRKRRAMSADELDAFKSEVTAMERKRVIGDELDELANAVIDPVKGKNFFTKNVLYPALNTAAYSAQAFVPYAGLPLLIGSTLGMRSQEMMDRGMSIEDAQKGALASALLEAPIEMIQAKMVVGNLPLFKKLLEVPVEGFASLAKRTGAVLGVQMVEQNLQEGFQDAMPLLVQEVGSFISEAVPGVDGKKELAEYAKGRVDTFWALLPMVLIGTGSATFSDAAFGRQYFNDVRALKAVGFTDEAVTKIMEAPSLEEKQAVMKSMWSDEQMRVMNGVAQQAAFADLDADMQASYIEQGSGEGAQIRRLEDGMFEVTTPDGELLDNTSSPDAALELARDWNAADQLNETAAIEDMIGYVESFQEAGQSIELMDKSKTLQDRVDAGDFTQEEADGIVQLYTEMGRLNEGATPGSVLITGENEVTKYDARRRIVSDVSRIYDGASPLTVVEEHAEGYLKRRLADGSVTLEDIVRWRKSTGSTVTDASERALIEWFSEQSQAYLVGKSNAEALPATFRQFLSKLRKYLGKILDLSVRLMDLEASGKMDGNFKTHLARSVGLDQAHIDAQMRAEEVGQMDGRGTELMGWLKGKLPHPDTAKANGEQLAGELATVWEGFKSPQAARAFFAPKGVYTPLDQLAGMARDDGFPFETADDLLKAIDSSLRGEEVFADAGTGATFSLSDSRAKPEDASNVTVLPDGAQLVGPTTFSLTAYHGTPHKVDKFSMDKIGTGEGAQAYGWGLYFAENKAVGEEYRRSLSDNMLSRDVLKEYFKEGAIIPSYGGMDRVVKLNLGVDVANWSVDVQAVVPDGKGGWKKESDYGTGIRNHSTYPSPKNLDKLGIKRGNLYTVELLPDADDFLDWDKPLREQSDKVKEALAKVDNRLVKALAEVAAGGRPRDVAVSHGVNVIDLYLGSGGAMVQTLGGDAAASKTLAAAGIPGIRYLDGASRGKGGTSNYVIFDESLVKIIEENGKKVEQAGATFSPADISAKWEARGIKNQVSEKGGVITLSSIRVSDTEQAQGLGTAAMKELTAYADKSGQMIALTPSVDFGASSVGRLRDFYKRFGFVENKGRNKDFRVRETMIREAKKGGKADITMGMESLDRANEIKAVMRKHKIAARVAAADHQGEAFSPEMRKAMEDRLYRVVPNKETVAEALKVVTEKGVGNALELVLSRTSTLTPNVQVALGMALMEHFNAKKQFEKAIEVGERVNELGTELGRGVQAFSLLGNVLDTPEKAQIFLSNKLKSLEAALRERKPVIDASKEVLANVQEEALKLLEKWLDEINGVSGKPMASRKAVRTEDLPDITFALSQDVRKSGIVSVVARMLKESGAAETRKALVEKYGDKVAPHVADILIEAQKQLTAKAAAKKAKPKVDKPGAAAEDKGKDRSGPRMSEEEIDNALAEIHATGRKVGFQDQMVAIEEHFQGKRMTDAQIEDTLALGRAMGIGGTTTTLEGFDDLVKRFEDEVINRLKVKGHDAPKSLRDAVRKLFETKGVKFTREDIARVFAEKFKVPKATETQNKRLVELAENIRSTPEFSTARTDATVELMNHVNEILKPVDWVDIGWSLWYANVLSGYNTHFRNLYANTLEQMVSLPLEAMRANPVKTLQLMREMLYGVKAGASIGLAEAKNQLKTGEASVLQTESNKFGSSGTLERVDFAGGQANPFNWLKVVGRALRAEDLFAYATAQEAKARMVAWEMADAKGLIGAERQAEVEKLLNATDEQIGDFAERAAREWDGLSDELKAKGNREQWEARRVKELRLLERDGALIERASEFAARATFNYKPDGFVGLMANSLIDVMNGLGRADTTGQAEVVQKALMTAPKLVVPFVRIVANVLNRGIDYTGMGIARSAFETKRVGAAAGKNGFVAKSADERAMELKRGIFGIVALGVLSSLANPDDPEAEIQIHGSGAGSREKNQALNGPRWMPYSIEFRGKEGSKFYTFQYSPLLMGLALVGNYHDAKRYRKLDEKDLTERLAVAAAGVGSVLLDQSFLSNAADLVNMFGRDGQVSQNALYSFMGRTFNPSTVAIPFSSLLRQLERDFDPVQRSKPDIKAALFSNVPVAARANDPALDILGDAIANRPFDWLARASVDGTPEARIYRAFGAKDLVPTSVWSYKGKMEPEQFYQFTKERGALLKESLMRNDAAFLKLIESSNEEVAAKILENLSRSATQMARVRVGYFPEVKTKTK